MSEEYELLQAINTQTQGPRTTQTYFVFPFPSANSEASYFRSLTEIGLGA
jgi:hypothetical protein